MGPSMTIITKKLGSYDHKVEFTCLIHNGEVGEDKQQGAQYGL